MLIIITDALIALMLHTHSHTHTHAHTHKHEPLLSDRQMELRRTASSRDVTARAPVCVCLCRAPGAV